MPHNRQHAFTGNTDHDFTGLISSLGVKLSSSGTFLQTGNFLELSGGTVTGTTTFTNGSVGIGTTNPDATAIVDITSTTKGFLIPRITNTQRDAISSAATGLMIYSTTDSVFEFWNGSSWISVATPASVWSIIGNSGTTPGTNFIGTTDSAAIYFKQNNILAGQIDFANQNYGFGDQGGVAFTNGVGIENSWLGYRALKSMTTGAGNVAIGQFALTVATTIDNSVAIGAGALASCTTGNHNTAVGAGALTINSTGHENSALGLNALAHNTVGSTNTGVGLQAGGANTTGSDNTYLGALAGYQITVGSQNTALGANSLGNVNTSNCTAVGWYALGNPHAGLGQFNNAFGYQALYVQGTGAHNSAFGTQSLFANNSGANNTAIGDFAGQSNVSGSNNTFLGYSADVVSGALSNSTAIGAFAQAGASNVLILGGITGVNGGTSVNVGIGTTTPNATLEITSPAAIEAQRIDTTATNTTNNSMEQVFQADVLTTGATQTNIQTFAVPSATTFAINTMVVARRTGGSAGTAEDGGRFEIKAVFKNVAGVATQIGTTTTVADSDQLSWNAAFVLSSGNVSVAVTGATNNNISWVVTSRIYKISS